MKKLIALCTGIVSAFSLITAIPAYAEEYAAPTFYFGVDNAQNVSVNGDTVTIRKSNFDGVDFTLNVNVYIDDPDLKSWYVSPKWKCASEYITLSNVFKPDEDNYEFAYGIFDDNGWLKYSVACGEDDTYNTMYFTCQPHITASDRSEMTPLGETSDAYPLTNFDAVISSDIPNGEYEIYFLTESEDYTDQQTSSGSFRMEDGSSKSYNDILNVRSLTIVIDSSEPLLGDVDYNGVVDVVDATFVLQQYSYSSMGGESILNDEQINLGNVDANTNADGTPLLDVVDATHILRYYSYLSMDDSFTWEDLFAM